MKSLHTIIQQSLSAEELIRALYEAYPDCHPKTSMSEREIWMKVGERNLVVKLQEIVDRLSKEEP